MGAAEKSNDASIKPMATKDSGDSLEQAVGHRRRLLKPALGVGSNINVLLLPKVKERSVKVCHATVNELSFLC